MKTTYLFLLCLMVAVEFMLSSSSILGTMPSKDQHLDSIPTIVRDVIRGALKGKEVTLVMPTKLNEADHLLNEITQEAGSPLFLMSLPREIPTQVEDYVMNPNNTNKRHTDVQYIDTQDNEVYFPSSPGVVIMMLPSAEKLWWPLQFPSMDWSANAILVISPTPSCWTASILETPLLHITTWVALICPSISQGGKQKGQPTDYKVWTWLPAVTTQKLVNLGTWNPEVFRSWEMLFLDRFQDLSENTVQILGNPIDWPFYYLDDGGNPAGQTLRIVEATSLRLGSKVNVTSNKEIDYTSIEKLIQKGQVDFMVNFVNPTPVRYQDFQLSIPYAFESFGLIVEEPPPLPRWQNILYPFTSTVWAYVIGSVLATSVTFHIPYYKHEKSFINNTITITQSILSNPLAYVPDGWNIRLFMLTWWMAGWLINLSYTCNLISIFTIPVFPKKIQTVEELAESHYRLCMLDYGEFVQEALLTSPHEKYKTLGNKMDMVPLLEHMPHIGVEACAYKVIDGTHAHTEAMPFLELLHEELGFGSMTYVMKEKLYPAFLIIIVYKYLPWKYKLDIDIQRLLESGVAGKWYDGIMDHLLGPKFKKGTTVATTAITLSHLQGSFFLFFFGNVLGLLAMASEVLFPPSKQKAN